MKVTVNELAVVYESDDRVAGVLVLDDPFKPYLHPLRTPKGYDVTVAMPVDHRHHKGLMYALRCDDLNFWEEDPGTDKCGVQRILDVVKESREGFDGVVLELVWAHEEGKRQTYREKRFIGCRMREDGKAFEWLWTSDRESLRAHRLIKSEWSLEIADGRKINYHGLGIRLPWAWSFPIARLHGFVADGKEMPFEEGCGSAPRKATFHGSFDGKWSPDRGAVSIEQDKDYAFFVLCGDFPYLSVGPSNAEELDVAAGETFSERFVVSVEDL